jgi:RNA polymerase-binding transcription factor DksA
MEAKELEQFRQRLLAEKRKLLADLERINQDIKENTREQYLEGAYEPDVASDLFEQEQTLVEQASLNHTLGEVEKALHRIEQGTYGLSLVSGKPIPIERLEALPWATCLVEEAAAQPV